MEGDRARKGPSGAGVVICCLSIYLSICCFSYFHVLILLSIRCLMHCLFYSLFDALLFLSLSYRLLYGLYVYIRIVHFFFCLNLIPSIMLSIWPLKWNFDMENGDLKYGLFCLVLGLDEELSY
jgi:hypothetical protein